ncbi:glycosyltransferase 87 family protein [Corynebacterium halotolerans]|uniref:glycosyltransferase 87 family protein n=1 Tax=Corynebacterium halotolerans TaxID=225326 RepID=UPI003CE9372A
MRVNLSPTIGTAGTPKPRLSSPRHRAGTMVAVIAALAVLAPWVFGAGIFPGTAGEVLRYHIDFHVYREGAQALLAGDNLYTRSYEVRGITLPFTYPPLAAILFIPLTWLPLMVGAALWTLVTAALLWWCMVIVLRHCTPGRSAADHRTLATWLLPVALLFEPVRETLSFGQINVLLMTVVLVDTLTRRPWLPRGVFIGLAAAVKLTPAVFILYFLVRRDWRGAATAVGSGVAFTLAAAAVNPALSWTYWLDTLSDTGRIGGLAYTANQSIQGLLFRVLPEDVVDPVWLVLVVLALAGIIAAMVRVHRAAATPGGSAVGLVVLNSLVALVCSPVSWSHHWVWLVPLAIVLGAAVWRTRASGDRVARALAGGVLVLTVSCSLLQPHWNLPNTQDRELDWALWMQPWGNTFVIIAVFTVVSVLLMPHILLPGKVVSTPGNGEVSGHVPPQPFLARGWALVQLVVAVVLAVGSVALWFR